MSNLKLQFTQEQLGIMYSVMLATTVKGQDARKVAEILDIIEKELNKE